MTSFRSSPRRLILLARTAFLLSPRRSGDVSAVLATNGDASSGFFAVRFFFLARGNVGVAKALAGSRGTTEARNGERDTVSGDTQTEAGRTRRRRLEARGERAGVEIGLLVALSALMEGAANGMQETEDAVDALNALLPETMPAENYW